MENGNTSDLELSGLAQGDSTLIEHSRNSHEATAMEFYNRQPFGLDQMTPDEVVVLSGQLEETIAREREGKDLEEIGDVITPADHRLGDFISELEFMASHNSGQAKEVYTALVNSEDVDTRAVAAVIIQELAKVDPEGALPLWEKLISDPHGGVRYSAYDSLLCVAEAGDLGDKLTLTQVAPLFRAYLES